MNPCLSHIPDLVRFLSPLSRFLPFISLVSVSPSLIERAQRQENTEGLLAQQAYDSSPSWCPYQKATIPTSWPLLPRLVVCCSVLIFHLCQLLSEPISTSGTSTTRTMSLRVPLGLPWPLDLSLVPSWRDRFLTRSDDETLPLLLVSGG